MKDSGVEWIGEIPEDWDISKVRRGFRVSKTIAGDKANELPRLSLSNAGVLERPKYDGFGESPADYATYQIIPGGQFVFNFMGLEQDSLYRRVGISPMTGLVSAGYMEADYISTQINPEYAYYFFRFMENGLLFKQYGSGIRSNLNKQQFHNMPFLFPPLDEQARISAVIKHKVEAIDTIISETQQSIDELKKYKQALITETVTKGLDKNVEMKDSGIEWIKKVPKSWEIKKTRFFLKEVSEKNYPNEEILSLYRDYGVIPKNSRDDNHNVTSLDTSGYKLVNHNQLVINKMKAWQGSMAISEIRGIISPAYYVYEVLDKQIYTKFLHYALRNNAYLDEYRRISAGLRIGQWDLNKDLFKNVKIAFPSTMDEQRQIVDFLEEKIKWIDNIVIEKEQLLIQFEQLKQSLIYEYVTGKKEA